MSFPLYYLPCFLSLSSLLSYLKWIRKSILSDVYTPFDYMTGQSVHEFQEENKENEQGEEKEKGIIRINENKEHVGSIPQSTYF